MWPLELSLRPTGRFGYKKPKVFHISVKNGRRLTLATIHIVQLARVTFITLHIAWNKNDDDDDDLINLHWSFVCGAGGGIQYSHLRSVNTRSDFSFIAHYSTPSYIH